MNTESGCEMAVGKTGLGLWVDFPPRSFPLFILRVVPVGIHGLVLSWCTYPVFPQFVPSLYTPPLLRAYVQALLDEF